MGGEHTLSPNFFLGSPRTKMKNWSENFWRAYRAQNNGFPNFSPALGCFSLWRHCKPLKIVNFLKTVKFFKKVPQIFFACGRLLFDIYVGRSILRNWSVKEGGVKNILYPPLDNVCLNETPKISQRLPRLSKRKLTYDYDLSVLGYANIIVILLIIVHTGIGFIKREHVIYVTIKDDLKKTLIPCLVQNFVVLQVNVLL